MSSWRDELKFDLTEASSLLAAKDLGGAASPLRMLVMYGARPYLSQPQAVASYIAGQLGKLGIGAQIESTRGSKDYYRRVGQGDYDLVLAGWIADTLDPADYLESCLAAEAIPSPSEVSFQANLARWRDETVTDLLRRLRTEPGAQTQEALLRFVADEMPLLPLITGAHAYVHSFSVRNFEPDPLGLPEFYKLDLRSL
jgi:ABC-type transport system substrate-binding protein